MNAGLWSDGSRSNPRPGTQGREGWRRWPDERARKEKAGGVGEAYPTGA